MRRLTLISKESDSPLRTLEFPSAFTEQVLQTPIIWLGQNLRNRVLLAQHADLRCAPVVVSLGDAFLRPSYKDRFFTERLRDSLGMRGPLMVDSGGYALMSRRSMRCRLNEIERIYAKLPADILVSLDYPPSPNDDRVTRNRLHRKTLRNLARLRDVLPTERLMPVVHGHSVKELERACRGVKRLCGDTRQIGIGGLVPLICSGGLVRGFNYVRENGTIGDRGQWIADALKLVRRFFPAALIHVFGVGSATTAIGVLALGADSVDSMSWRRAANYGAILLPGRSERFPLFQNERSRSRPVLGDHDLPRLQACVCPVCTSLPTTGQRAAMLAKGYTHRAIHNAWTVLAEVAAFRKAIQEGKAVEFLDSRLAPLHRLYQPVRERMKDWVKSIPPPKM